MQNANTGTHSLFEQLEYRLNCILIAGRIKHLAMFCVGDNSNNFPTAIAFPSLENT